MNYHVDVYLFSADKTKFNLVEDWKCPNPNGIRYPKKNNQPIQIEPPNIKDRNVLLVKEMHGKQSIIIHPGLIATMVLGSIFIILIIIGLIAYFKARHNR